MIDTFFIKQNLRFQEESNKRMELLTKSIAFQKPHWTPVFTENYLKSRYPDIWFYHVNLYYRYHELSKPLREMYRLRLVMKDYVCDDVIKYTQSFIE